MQADELAFQEGTFDALFVLRCENEKVAEIWMKGNITTS